MAEHDILIRDGSIADGSGAAVRSGDVAIRDGIIIEVGKVDTPARRTIDAAGALVTPGFIDVHTHYDGQVLWDEQLEPSFSNGVTTALAGNCGVGFAPVRPEHRDMLMELMAGVEDIPGAVLKEGLDWNWRSFPDYLDRVASRRYGLDFGVQVTHAPLRVFVMGERAARHEAATPEDIAEMSRLLVEAMDAGAMGFSAARFLGHRSSAGEFVPGTFADDAELLALAAAMGSTGKGVFQIVPHGAAGDIMGKAASREERLAEHDRFVRLAKAAGGPLTYMLLQFQSDPSDWQMMLDASDRANREGAQIHPQTAPRATGALTHLEGYHPFMLRPSYLQIAGLALPDRVRAMRDPARRRAILTEEDAETADAAQAMLVASYKNAAALYPMSLPIDYEPDADQTLALRAARSGTSLEEALYDHLVAGDGNDFAATFAANYVDRSLDTVHRLLTHPNVISGLGDAGAHVKFVSDGSMPSFQLAFWTRDRRRGPRLPMEFVVKKLTGDNADLYGLADRGVLAPGKRADINVIDLDRLQVDLPRMAFDLPSGAGRLLQRSAGYVATMVAGQITRWLDEDTGARPGRLIRSGRLR